MQRGTPLRSSCPQMRLRRKGRSTCSQRERIKGRQEVATRNQRGRPSPAADACDLSLKGGEDPKGKGAARLSIGSVHSDLPLGLLAAERPTCECLPADRVGRHLRPI